MPVPGAGAWKRAADWPAKILLLLISVELALQLLSLMLPLCARKPAGLKPRDTFRILCLGESTTAAQLHTKDYSWPAQLEEILNRRYGRERVEIINRGKVGTNTSIVLLELPRYLDEDKPDLVISMLGINDRKWYGTIHRNISYDALNHLRTYKLLRHLWYYYIEDRLKSQAVEGVAMMKTSPDLSKDPLAARCLLSLALDVKTLPASEEICKKTISKYPSNSQLYWMLGHIYRNRSQTQKSLEMFLRSMELDPEFEQNYIFLAAAYLDLGETSKAEQVLKMALEKPFSRLNDTPALMLIELYLGETKNLKRKAEHIFSGILAKNLRRSGNVVISGGLNPEPDPFTPDNAVTRLNYNQIYALIRSRGIQLVAMQYPMEEIQRLQTLFSPNLGVELVDNHVIFKKMLASRPYSDFFADYFGTDWGHCTREGNRVIAENLARELRRRDLIPAR
jgi:lysophospholipase L1-like esterase